MYVSVNVCLGDSNMAGQILLLLSCRLGDHFATVRRHHMDKRGNREVYLSCLIACVLLPS